MKRWNFKFDGKYLKGSIIVNAPSYKKAVNVANEALRQILAYPYTLDLVKTDIPYSKKYVGVVWFGAVTKKEAA